MLTAELRIRLDEDETFQLLSERLQRIIDEKRAGTLAGIALIEELERLTEAVRAAVEESKRPLGQQLALKIKARNPALTETQAAEVAAAILEEADKRVLSTTMHETWSQPGLESAVTHTQRRTADDAPFSSAPEYQPPGSSASV